MWRRAVMVFVGKSVLLELPLLDAINIRVGRILNIGETQRDALGRLLAFPGLFVESATRRSRLRRRFKFSPAGRRKSCANWLKR